MIDKELYDISEVCSLLNTTSRTLRFYEEKGLIESVKSFSNRRQYNKQQIELIKKILALRTLGLSVAQIINIQNGCSDLKQAIIQHKAENIARIVARTKENGRIDEALNTIACGGDIFEDKNSRDSLNYNAVVFDLTNSFIKGDIEHVFNSFSETLREYTPLLALKRIVADSLLPLGGFVRLEIMKRDKENKNIFYSYLRYEKLGLIIKFVLHDNKINGFWLSYYELKE